jgi:hypothetical protein
MSATQAGRAPFERQIDRCLAQGPDQTTWAVLAECKRQQTGAQQHEAGRGQYEESVGDQIVVAHDTPATLDARPN